MLDDGYEPARAKANTEKFLNDDVFALFGYVGTPTSLAALPLVKDSGIPFFGPFTGAMALRHARAAQRVPRARLVRRRDGADRQPVAQPRPEEDRRLPPERRLRPGRPGRHRQGAEGAGPRARGGRHVRAQHRQRRGGRQGHRAPPSPTAWCRSARTRPAPSSSARPARPATAASSSTCRSSARRRCPTSSRTEALGVVVSQVMPYPFSGAVPIVRDYLDAVKAAGGDATANYSSLEGYIDARIFVEGLRRGRANTREGLADRPRVAAARRLRRLQPELRPRARGIALRRAVDADGRRRRAPLSDPGAFGRLERTRHPRVRPPRLSRRPASAGSAAAGGSAPARPAGPGPSCASASACCASWRDGVARVDHQHAGVRLRQQRAAAVQRRRVQHGQREARAQRHQALARRRPGRYSSEGCASTPRPRRHRRSGPDARRREALQRAQRHDLGEAGRAARGRCRRRPAAGRTRRRPRRRRRPAARPARAPGPARRSSCLRRRACC